MFHEGFKIRRVAGREGDSVVNSGSGNHGIDTHASRAPGRVKQAGSYPCLFVGKRKNPVAKDC